MIRSLANCWAIFFLVLKPASSIAPSFNSHSANFIKGLIKSLRTFPRFREAPGSNLSRTVKRLRATTFIFAQSAVVWHWELWEVRSLSKTNLTWKIMWIFVNDWENFVKGGFDLKTHLDYSYQHARSCENLKNYFLPKQNRSAHSRRKQRTVNDCELLWKVALI